jgi:hypothetical protein
MFEIAHQVNCAVARPDHLQVHGDAPVLAAFWFESSHLHSAREHGLEVLHRQGPGESFRIEEFVKHGRLFEQLRVSGLAHQVFVALPFLGNPGDLAVQRMITGAGYFGFPMNGVQAHA